MKRKNLLTLAMLVTMLVSLVYVSPVAANPPAPGDGVGVTPSTDIKVTKDNPGKSIDQPNVLDVMKIRARDILLKQGNVVAAQELMASNDRVLVILVEYAGTDKFTWTPGVSTWDPIGKADISEDANNNDCSKIAGLPTVATEFTYGPTLHNEIPRPLSAEDRSGDTIWTENFSPDWYKAFMFGDGVKFNYQREDGSIVNEDFTGKSVKKFYEDMSGNTYHIEGDVIGWIQLPHSTWWYGADTCPGRRSQSLMSSSHNGGIPEAGNAKTLVTDAVSKVEEMRLAGELPGFDWKNYDINGDGVVDRLWIVHAGYGEEDSTTLLNRTDYSEASMWSHSSSVSPTYSIGDTGYKVSPYIMMPENGGIGVFAHEYGHNLGADDLYAYGLGETSAGFWTTMADDWTGYPIGYQPPAMDPWHLDEWGWLNPYTITDPTKVYEVTVGQASNFPGGDGVYRGVKIELPDGHNPLPIGPANGNYMWFGGNLALMNSRMTTKNPVAVPSGGATLTFNLAHGIETAWDFLWVQASTDGGTTWATLRSTDPTAQSCVHDPSWIGELNGFPTDLCGAGIYGYTDYNASFPNYDQQTFDLSAADFGGKDTLLRFWYMTDWGTQYEGVFIDDVSVTAGTTTLLSDGAESGDANWTYSQDWVRSDGTLPFTHNYYLQWRNTGPDGGYDSGLGDPRFRYGPASTGLLVWYNNNFYTDNEVFNYLFDSPSFGPKGRMLVVDSNPEPYRDPYWVLNGYNNEGGNLDHRGMMRDAPFSLFDSVSFSVKPPYSQEPALITGRNAVTYFDDAFGYYPGAEYISRGPGYNPPSMRWVTKQWDASSVVPSLFDYPLNAPGYDGVSNTSSANEFRFDCARAGTGMLGCYWLGGNTGLGYMGGDGNPNQVGGQFGWRVQVLSQTAEKATLRIWNTTYNGALAPESTHSFLGDTLTYTFKVDPSRAATHEAIVCSDWDSSLAELDTFDSGVYPLAVDCTTAVGGLNKGAAVSTMTTPNASTAKAVLWSANLAQGGAAQFSYSVKVTKLLGTLKANAITMGVEGVVPAPPVSIVPSFKSFFPLLFNLFK